MEAVVLKEMKADQDLRNFDQVAETVTKSIAAWCKLNVVALDMSPDTMLGHSYLFDLAKALLARRAGTNADRRFFVASTDEATVLHIWNQQILPQLCESLEAAHKTPADKEWAEAIEGAAVSLGLSVAEDKTSKTAPLLRKLSIRFRPRPAISVDGTCQR